MKNYVFEKKRNIKTKRKLPMLTEDEKGRRENPVSSCLIYDPTNSLWNVNASFIIMLLLCAHIHAIYSISISIFLFMLISHCRETKRIFNDSNFRQCICNVWKSESCKTYISSLFTVKYKFFFVLLLFFLLFWVSMRKGFSRFSDDVSRVER